MTTPPPHRGPRGLFAGIVTMDLQFAVPGFPERNAKTYADAWAVAPGGPATNAATVFAHLGGAATLVTGVGRHPLTDFIMADLATSGIALVDLHAGQAVVPPIVSIISSRDNGDRTVITRRPDPVTTAPDPSILGAVDGADICLVDGFFLEAALALAARARDRGVPVVLDGGSWKEGLERLLALTDIAVVSERFRPPDLPAGTDVLTALHERFGCRRIAVTRGERGIRAFEDGHRFEVAAAPVAAVDTLAAGDFFHGAFCFAHATGQSFPAALAFAARVAGRSCAHFGTRAWLDHIDDLRGEAQSFAPARD
ncbi:MAG: sugar kinase [Rhodospirillales bacterium]|nr:MAG: sugar kinase [Rhodospirillales bacterium]